MIGKTGDGLGVGGSLTSRDTKAGLDGVGGSFTTRDEEAGLDGGGGARIWLES
jgi:hypothetical protein